MISNQYSNVITDQVSILAELGKPTGSVRLVLLTLYEYGGVPATAPVVTVKGVNASDLTGEAVTTTVWIPTSAITVQQSEEVATGIALVALPPGRYLELGPINANSRVFATYVSGF